MSRDNKTLDLVCLGEPMVEFNQSSDTQWVQGFGGDTSNCAISAARQGAKVGYITKLGADHFGDQVINLWHSENIDTDKVIRDPESPTGIYFVSHDVQGHHYTYYRKHSAASTLTPADISSEYIASARILHVSAISQAISDSAADTVAAAIASARTSQTLVAYDTNLRLNLWSAEKAQEVIHAAMKNCDIALPSYDDATVLTGKEKTSEIVEFYLQLGAGIVVLKCGGNGCIVATADRREHIKSIPVDTIDTNGAGDTFAGAFLAELANDANPFEAATYANQAAAISTTRNGAVTAIPERAEVEQALGNDV